MGRRRLVVIGGDAAGMSAASQARRRRNPDELEIVAFERGRATSYSACGIPYWISGAVEREEQLVSRSPEQHRRNGIDVRIRTEVVAIDLEARTVSARDLENGREYDEPWDDLVYATGSVPMRPPVPGIDAPGVYGVQTLDDGAALRAALDAGARRVVIVGGGYIGLEVAEACQVRGLDVTVVDLSPTPVGIFDPDIGQFIADAVRGLGITLVLSDGVAEVETGADGSAVAVRTASGRRLPADVVVLGLLPATTACAPRSRASGPRATASSRCTASPASGSWSRWAPMRTSRAEWPASTSAATTPPSPASSVPR
jgi:NADPH-dependent 2,4-dienoyl-CoA reductase/sulfur reductase-like enzyme